MGIEFKIERPIYNGSYTWERRIVHHGLYGAEHTHEIFGFWRQNDENFSVGVCLVNMDVRTEEDLGEEMRIAREMIAAGTELERYTKGRMLDETMLTRRRDAPPARKKPR